MVFSDPGRYGRHKIISHPQGVKSVGEGDIVHGSSLETISSLFVQHLSVTLAL